MRKELLIVISLFVLSFVLAFTAIVLNNIPIKDYLERPHGESFSIFSFLRNQEKPKKIVYGYLPYWTLDRSKYLQLDKLTDISYFGLTINSNGKIRRIGADGATDPGYNAWRNNKILDEVISNSKAANTRFAVTVISHEDDVSTAFLNCRNCWDTFLTELKSELDFKKIKDVNLNFEYVQYTDKETSAKYTEFSRYVNEQLDLTYGDSFVVVATFADSLVRPRVSSIPDLAQVVDGIFIMAYDFHTRGSDTAGPVSPLDGKGVFSHYDINTMLKDYTAVAPPGKLIMGVPYYGYNWVVNSSAPYAARLPGNDWVGYSQSQTYADIMETLIDLKPNILWDKLGQSPFFSYVSPANGSIRSVYFENVESLRIKYQLIKNYDLGGVGIWALGYDGGYTDLWLLLKEEFGS